jgi:DNA-binding transcriptional MerR regulator
MKARKLLTSDAAKILDVSPDLVRHLERSGVLPADRTPGGIRLYDPEDVTRLAGDRAARRREREIRRGREPK